MAGRIARYGDLFRNGRRVSAWQPYGVQGLRKVFAVKEKKPGLPTDIFKGLGKLILFTVLPAGFISYMPIGLLREIQPQYVLGLLAVIALLVLCGIAVFYRGLSRYSSGNRMGVRM